MASRPTRSKPASERKGSLPCALPSDPPPGELLAGLPRVERLRSLICAARSEADAPVLPIVQAFLADAKAQTASAAFAALVRTGKGRRIQPPPSCCPPMP